MAEMGPHSLVDHRLDQLRRMGVYRRQPFASTDWLTAQIALVATNALLSSQLIVGIISSMHPVRVRLPGVSSLTVQSFEAQRWQQFLIYIGFTLGAFLLNGFGNRILPVMYRGACMVLALGRVGWLLISVVTWSIGGFAVASITVLACSSPDYNSAR